MLPAMTLENASRFLVHGCRRMPSHPPVPSDASIHGTAPARRMARSFVKNPAATWPPTSSPT